MMMNAEADTDTSLRPAASSSPGRRENAQPNTIVGCMSGVFHLLSKHHRHNSRKLLTFGKKQEKNNNNNKCMGAADRAGIDGSSSCTSTISSKSSTTLISEAAKTKNVDKSLSSIDYVGRYTPIRSPTLPAEIRHMNLSAPPPVDSAIPPATLVARLMGLGGEAPLPRMMPLPKLTSSANINKKQHEHDQLLLLGALQKCDEDLKALKKMIHAVRASQALRSSMTSPTTANVAAVKMRSMEAAAIGGKGNKSFYGEQHFRIGNVRHHYSKKQILNYGRAQQPGEQMMRQQQRKKAGGEDVEDESMMNSNSSMMNNEELLESGQAWKWNSRKAMRECVSEVSRDIAWGEKREIGRIGLALQDHICKDLIEDLLKDMGIGMGITYSSPLPLPFEACKRRLRF